MVGELVGDLAEKVAIEGNVSHGVYRLKNEGVALRMSFPVRNLERAKVQPLTARDSLVFLLVESVVGVGREYLVRQEVSMHVPGHAYDVFQSKSYIVKAVSQVSLDFCPRPENSRQHHHRCENSPRPAFHLWI